ncbi:DUF3592 domain-containing protein [Collimonas sp. NPDC087041]|uniref:DUF3592 domain-containing protein n=1 Tax=Collimonas sp. NPDC087041 TaxID=3363960 RepID=UPI003823BC9C
MRIFKIVFLSIGVLFLLIAAFSSVSTLKFKKTALHTDGIVARLNERISQEKGKTSVLYYPVFAFINTNGTPQIVESSSGSHPAAYSVGDKVPMLYPADNPQDAQVDSVFGLWISTIVFALLGIGFFVPGLAMLIIPKMKENKSQKLRSTGLPVKAKITGVELNGSLQINGRSPWRIVCQWHNSSENRVHVFNSENLWFDPEDYLKSEEITVYIDRTNPKKYWVDTSFLPKT